MANLVGSNFARVISRDSIIIVFMYATWMTLMFVKQILRMLIFKLHHLKNITLYVGWNLEIMKEKEK